jgi:hypothetical protein
MSAFVGMSLCPVGRAPQIESENEKEGWDWWNEVSSASYFIHVVND